MADGEFRCYWTHDHGPHDWVPLVEDPEVPQVLHLFRETVRCPGVDSTLHDHQANRQGIMRCPKFGCIARVDADGECSACGAVIPPGEPEPGTWEEAGRIGWAKTVRRWDSETQTLREDDQPPYCPEHHETQHRDGKPPWCEECGWRHAVPSQPARELGTPHRRES